MKKGKLKLYLISINYIYKMKKIIFYIYKKCWDIIANPTKQTHQGSYVVWTIIDTDYLCNCKILRGAGRVLHFNAKVTNYHGTLRPVGGLSLIVNPVINAFIL